MEDPGVPRIRGIRRQRLRQTQMAFLPHPNLYCERVPNVAIVLTVTFPPSWGPPGALPTNSDQKGIEPGSGVPQ